MRTPLTPAEVHRRLDDLLIGRDATADGDMLPGAELAVFDDDLEVFRAALARHARRADLDEALIWVRPIGPSAADSATGLPSFDLAIMRRRALEIRAAWFEERGLVLDLVTGQRAIVRLAQGAQLKNLQDFDTWMTTLPEDARLEVEALDHD